MAGSDTGGVVAAVVISVLITLYLVVAFHRETRRMPAAIVRRLFRTDRPVRIVCRHANAYVWDPSRQTGGPGIHDVRSATYSLERPATIHVRYVRKSGEVVERVAEAPGYLLPDTPETHRRRVIARAVIALYAAIGLAAFTLTATFVSGSSALRIRVAALVALVSVAITWLAAHFVLTRDRRRPSAEGGHPPLVHARRLVEWVVGYAVVSTVLAVAWQLGSRDEPHPASWANALLSAGVFVLATAAALAASLHHHTYIHHADHHQPPAGSSLPGAGTPR